MIPKTWKKIKLGDVCLSIKNKSHEGHNPYIEIGDINLNNKKYSYKEKKSVKGANFAYANNILISKVRPTRGAITKINENKISVSNAFVILKPLSILDPQLLFFYLGYNNNFLNYLGGKCKGTLYPSCKENNVLEYSLNLPPLPTQKRIIAEIEKQFSRLDDGLHSLIRTKENLKKYKASTLNKLYSKSKNQGTMNNLKSIINNIGQGWSPKCETKPSKKGEWGVIKTTAVQRLTFIENENKLLPKKLKPKENLEIKTGDILMTRAGPKIRVGITCLVGECKEKLICCDKVYRININKNLINPLFFVLIVNSPFFMNKLNKIKTGIDDSGVNITQKKLLELNIPVPTLEVQLKLIKIVEENISVIEKLEKIVEENIRKAKSLKQSILKKTFEGRLVETKEEDGDVNDLLVEIKKEKKRIEAEEKAKKKTIRKKK